MSGPNSCYRIRNRSCLLLLIARLSYFKIMFQVWIDVCHNMSVMLKAESSFLIDSISRRKLNWMFKWTDLTLPSLQSCLWNRALLPLGSPTALVCGNARSLQK
jgi:hypothetical protein